MHWLHLLAGIAISSKVSASGKLKILDGKEVLTKRHEKENDDKLKESTVKFTNELERSQKQAKASKFREDRFGKMLNG